MVDICTESVVRIYPKLIDRIIKYILLGVIGICLIALLFVGYEALIPLAIAALFLYFHASKTDSEYEYIHTNNLFDVDLVIRNSRRKSVVSAKLDQVIIVAPAGSHDLENYLSLPEKDLTGNGKNNAIYEMVCMVSGKRQKLLLQLDRRMLHSLKQWIPDKVK